MLLPRNNFRTSKNRIFHPSLLHTLQKNHILFVTFLTQVRPSNGLYAARPWNIPRHLNFSAPCTSAVIQKSYPYVWLVVTFSSFVTSGHNEYLLPPPPHTRTLNRIAATVSSSLFVCNTDFCIKNVTVSVFVIKMASVWGLMQLNGLNCRRFLRLRSWESLSSQTISPLISSLADSQDFKKGPHLGTCKYNTSINFLQKITHYVYPIPKSRACIYCTCLDLPNRRDHSE
jgi:hypothetical protein